MRKINVLLKLKCWIRRCQRAIEADQSRPRPPPNRPTGGGGHGGKGPYRGVKGALKGPGGWKEGLIGSERPYNRSLRPGRTRPDFSKTSALYKSFTYLLKGPHADENDGFCSGGWRLKKSRQKIEGQLLFGGGGSFRLAPALMRMLIKTKVGGGSHRSIEGEGLT